MKAGVRSGAGRFTAPRVVRSADKPTEVSGPFVCGWSAVGDCVVVRVAGTIDRASAPTLSDELRRVIITKRPTLVVDLRRVTDIDAAGIEVLAMACDLAIENDGWLRVSGAAPRLADLMEKSGLCARVQQYATLAEALPSYRPA
jgi:anti-anti-sigma factor